MRPQASSLAPAAVLSSPASASARPAVDMQRRWGIIYTIILKERDISIPSFEVENPRLFLVQNPPAILRSDLSPLDLNRIRPQGSGWEEQKHKQSVRETEL